MLHRTPRRRSRRRRPHAPGRSRPAPSPNPGALRRERGLARTLRGSRSSRGKYPDTGSRFAPSAKKATPPRVSAGESQSCVFAFGVTSCAASASSLRPWQEQQPCAYDARASCVRLPSYARAYASLPLARGLPLRGLLACWLALRRLLPSGLALRCLLPRWLALRRCLLASGLTLRRCLLASGLALRCLPTRGLLPCGRLRLTRCRLTTCSLCRLTWHPGHLLSTNR